MSFKNSVIIMTSNLGSAQIFEHLPSDSREALRARVMAEVRGHFRWAAQRQSGAARCASSHRETTLSPAACVFRLTMRMRGATHDTQQRTWPACSSTHQHRLLSYPCVLFFHQQVLAWGLLLDGVIISVFILQLSCTSSA